MENPEQLQARLMQLEDEVSHLKDTLAAKRARIAYVGKEQEESQIGLTTDPLADNTLPFKSQFSPGNDSLQSSGLQDLEDDRIHKAFHDLYYKGEIKEITEEEVLEHYNDYFLPPMFQDKESLRREYRKNADYAVVEQNSNMDFFVGHVESVMGAEASRTLLRRPLVFRYKPKRTGASLNFIICKFVGVYVVDEAVIGVIKEFFQYKDIADLLRARKTAGKEGHDKLFMNVVLPSEKIRNLWADVVAYALLLRMDYSKSSYVDRERSRINRISFDRSKKEAARVFVEHYLRP